MFPGDRRYNSRSMEAVNLASILADVEKLFSQISHTTINKQFSSK